MKRKLIVMLLILGKIILALFFNIIIFLNKNDEIYSKLLLSEGMNFGPQYLENRRFYRQNYFITIYS